MNYFRPKTIPSWYWLVVSIWFTMLISPVLTQPGFSVI